MAVDSYPPPPSPLPPLSIVSSTQHTLHCRRQGLALDRLERAVADEQRYPGAPASNKRTSATTNAGSRPQPHKQVQRRGNSLSLPPVIVGAAAPRIKHMFFESQVVHTLLQPLWWAGGGLRCDNSFFFPRRVPMSVGWAEQFIHRWWLEHWS